MVGTKAALPHFAYDNVLLRRILNTGSPRAEQGTFQQVSVSVPLGAGKIAASNPPMRTVAILCMIIAPAAAQERRVVDYLQDGWEIKAAMEGPPRMLVLQKGGDARWCEMREAATPVPPSTAVRELVGSAFRDQGLTPPASASRPTRCNCECSFWRQADTLHRCRNHC
jgi:hypothetical protein